MKSYFVGADEAEAQGDQRLDYCRAAVALDRVVGLQPWYNALPAQVLPHQGTEVTHHKRTLLRLENTMEYMKHLVSFGGFSE